MKRNIILAQIDADAKAGKVIVWACYLPHHIFGMHPLAIIEEPEHDPEKWQLADLPNDPELVGKFACFDVISANQLAYGILETIGN